MSLLVRRNLCLYCETGYLNFVIGSGAGEVVNMTNKEDQSQAWAEGKGSLSRYHCCLPLTCINTGFFKNINLNGRNPKKNSNKLLMVYTETKSPHAAYK